MCIVLHWAEVPKDVPRGVHAPHDGLGRVSLRVRGAGHGELTLKKATKLGVLEGVHRPCTKALRLVSDLRLRGCCLLYAACMMHNQGGGLRWPAPIAHKRRYGNWLPVRCLYLSMNLQRTRADNVQVVS